MKENITMHTFEDIKVLVVSGGKGTRLSTILEEIPKPMISILGKPLLERLLLHAKKYRLKKFLFKTGYLSEKIESYFGNGRNYNCKIEYLIEKELLGTCGGLNFLKNEKNPVIVIYGDTLININLIKLLKYHYSQNAQVTLVVHESDHPEDSDIVVRNDDGQVIDIIHKPGSNQFGNISNAALYVINPECFSEIPEKGVWDFGKNLIPKLIAKKYKIFAYLTTEYIKDIGTVKRYNEVLDDITHGKVYNRVQAVFLDRDGVINIEKGLISKKEDLSLMPDASYAIGLLNDVGIPSFVTTNQPVIARNMCTLEELEEIHTYLCQLLNKEGVYLNDIYYCPHHPDKGFPEENVEFKCRCTCRKPQIGLLKEVEKEYNLDLKQCFIIGDSTTDIQTGINAGCRTILLKTGYAGMDKKYSVYPDYIFNNFSEAVKFIVKYNSTSLYKIICVIKSKLYISDRVVLLIEDSYSEKGKHLLRTIRQSIQNEVTVINLNNSESKNILSKEFFEGITTKKDDLTSDNQTLARGKLLIIEGRKVLANSALLQLANIKIYVDHPNKKTVLFDNDFHEFRFDNISISNADFIF